VGGGHCHEQKSERVPFIEKWRVKRGRIRCYLGEGGRLHGKPGTGNGTGEEGDECRGKEWDDHASIFSIIQEQKRGEGGQERMPRKPRR